MTYRTSAASFSTAFPVMYRKIDGVTLPVRWRCCQPAPVGAGLSIEDFARYVTVRPDRVETHVNRAMAELDAHDEAQLVVIVYEGARHPGKCAVPRRPLTCLSGK